MIIGFLVCMGAAFSKIDTELAYLLCLYPGFVVVDRVKG